ncbi:MAG: amidohydrolase family protein [Thermoplasmata archaeon]
MDRTPRADTHLHLSRWWQDLAHTGYRADIDYTVTGLLREMDANGIDFGLAIQIIETPNARAGLTESRSILETSGGRLRPVVTVDPTKGSTSVEETLSLWEHEEGMAGIKLFPGYRPFYPHDPRLAPVYEFAHRRGFPVLVHQGDTLHRDGLVKYARPVELDEVAVRYPDVRFVLCHFGNPWVEEAAEIVYKNENMYVDTSGLLGHPSTPFFPRMVEQCRVRLLNAIISIGSTDRVLYGSDWPLEELKVAVELVDGLDLPLADREKILGGNARRLFSIPGEVPS